MDQYKNLQLSEKGARLSIYAYIFISTIKLSTGYIGESTALKADGLNNCTDVISSICILVGLKFAQKPPDRNHPYGHLRAETIASFISAIIMLFIGWQVLASSIEQVIIPTIEKPSQLTAYVSLFCAFLMFIVYRYNLKLARRTKSMALKSAAYDNFSDALVSIGTTIGIAGAIYGFPIIDAITALIIGLIIMKTGFNIAFEAVNTLIDGFDWRILRLIERNVRPIIGVKAVHSIKGRMYGNQAYIELIVELPKQITLLQTEAIRQQIHNTILKELPDAFISISIFPHK